MRIGTRNGCRFFLSYIFPKNSCVIKKYILHL
nr:MAG TPA_asm: hypothetical protein [Caudoviricetes sp.]